MSDWIEWNGGENPVPGKKVDVWFRNDDEACGDCEESEGWTWKHHGTSGDIVKYKVVDLEGQKEATMPEITKIFKHSDFNQIVEDTILEIKKLAEHKGGEYAGDTDRLANFRRNGERLGLPMETVWAVYAGKHIDAVFQYVQDLQTGTTRTRLEGIEGRVDDILVYMLLFKAMIKERNENVR